MAKRHKKRVHKQKNSGKVTKIIHESTKEIKLEKALIDNFISLQKVMVNLSSRFDNLSLQISKLLELFEISAKSLARKDIESLDKENREMKKVMEKLDNLTQQAGLIGKGLALIHEVNSEREIPSIHQPQPNMQRQMISPVKPIQRFNPGAMPVENVPKTQSERIQPVEKKRK